MGANVANHYCMNELIGTSFGYSEDDECGKCSMKETRTGCCKNENKFFKLKTQHYGPMLSNMAAASLQMVSFPVNFYTGILFFINKQPQAKPVLSPPYCGPPGLYKFYCVFLI